MATNVMFGSTVRTVKDASGDVTGLSAGGELSLQVGDIVKAAKHMWPGYHSKNPMQEMLIPFGTTLIDTRSATGATSTIGVDTTKMWNGKPSTVVTTTTTASSAVLGASSNATASITLGTEGQTFLGRRFIIPVKISQATPNTLNNIHLIIRAPDSSNQYLVVIDSVDYIGEVDGWSLYANFDLDSVAITGSPNLADLVRTMVNLNFTANINPGTFHFGPVYIVPEPAKKSLVITFDDGKPSWPWIAAEAAKRGIPISFGITWGNVDQSYGITKDEIRTIAHSYNGLHEITNHQLTHDTYTELGLSQYLINIETARNNLLALDIPARPLLFHAYPSGDFDDALAAALRDLGYLSARGTTKFSIDHPMAQNEVMAIAGPQSLKPYSILTGAGLGIDITVTEAIALITESAATGTCFTFSHDILAEAGTTWTQDYDADYGFLTFLDWVAARRDEDGWIIRKWSDWYDDQLDTIASIPL